MCLVLGINAYHPDAAACVVRDGTLVAAAEEERFRRIKHFAGFPSNAIAFCLREARASLDDLDIVAINTDPRARLLRKAAYVLGQRPRVDGLRDRVRHMSKRGSVTTALQEMFLGSRFRGRLCRVEHQLAHLMSGLATAGREDAVAVSIDGSGDFASAAWGVGRAGHIAIDGDVLFPHSLGIFYQALTQYLGFSNYGDEYKVMGLAAFGAPRFLREMKQIVRREDDGRFSLDLAFFCHHRLAGGAVRDDGRPGIDTLYSRDLEQLLGPARGLGDQLTDRHRDIACSVQAMYETALFHLLCRLSDKYRLRRLAMAGGCALNAVANGKITSRTGFTRLHIPPSPGDAGGAIGAALVAMQRFGGAMASPQAPVNHAYLGPSFLRADIDRVLTQKARELSRCGCRRSWIDDQAALTACVAHVIAEGAIVGWCQGRMEYGARALGNRSILCDPRRSDARGRLNAKIKFRERFRPFAPSVLAEHASDWFVGSTDVPFMSEVVRVRKERRNQIPAVTHVDGSARLHTVERVINPRFWCLIEAFRRRTGVPMLLNTSFNENEPIVCRPSEALDCFLRTDMDMLVMGNAVVWRGPWRNKRYVSNDT